MDARTTASATKKARTPVHSGAASCISPRNGLHSSVKSVLLTMAFQHRNSV